MCDEADVINVEKVATEVQHRVPAADRDDALAQALTYMVRHVVARGRVSTEIRAENATAYETVQHAPAESPAAPKVGRSWKRDGIREYWRRALTERYSIDRNGNLLPLGKLSREQVQFNIVAREEQARRSSAKALQLRGLLDLMVRHDVDQVADLPEQVLASILVRAA
ncbi:MAG: hypothetical protein AB7W59_01730 [Acidimicrobiia bacterium]